MTRKLPRARVVAFGLSSLLIVAGCGSDLAPVSGKVSLDGAPLSKAIVAFHPNDGGATAYGSVQDANYRVRTGQRDGVKPGNYRVTVAAYGEVPKTAHGETPPPLLTPAKYRDKSSSGLEYTVPSGGGVFDIELSSEGTGDR